MNNELMEQKLEEILQATRELKNQSPWKTKKELAERYSMTTRTVSERVKGIQEEVKNGRYNRMAVIEDSEVKVNEYVFIDYCKYKKHLENPQLRKCVPPFEPGLIRQLMFVFG